MCSTVESARVGTDAVLRRDGLLHPPSVQMLTEDRDEPLVGMVTCRRFYRGDDAARAVAGLGELPSVLRVSRLLVTYEAQDVNVALQAAVDPEATALVVLDAQLGGQRLCWWPLRIGVARRWRRDVIVPEWGRPEWLDNPPVPDPVTQLVTIWRQWRGGDAAVTAGRLQQAGYRIGWFTH